MKFGYVLPNFGDKISATELVDIATVCEESGFDSVWATDHVIVQEELKEPYGQLLEPLITLSFIASRTEKLKIGTSVLVLPQRNPVLVAKQAAALDVFSNGRVILGFGAGWSETEFANLGSDFANRGRVYDESIRLIRALWNNDIVNFEGRFFHVRDAVFLPKPVHGSIPIWLGGTSNASIRRAIRFADGWHPTGLTVEDFGEGVRKIRESGKKLTISMRITTDIRKKREDVVLATGEKWGAISGSRDDVLGKLEEYRTAGLDYLCASILHPSAKAIIADLRKFSSDIIRSYV